MIQPAKPKAACISLPFPGEASISACSFLDASRRRAGQQLGDCLAVEVGGQIPSQKRIVLRARHRAPHVISMIALRSGEGDEGGREFHLRILSPQADGLLDPPISVKPIRRIGFASPDPLLVSLGKIAGIKPRQSVGVTGGVGTSWVPGWFSTRPFVRYSGTLEATLKSGVPTAPGA